MLYPVVLSGGSGTRLWPVSREGHPKPFIRLPDGESLLHKVYQRAGALLAEVGELITVTNREYFFQSKDEFAASKLLPHRAHYLLEPMGRNTAAAIAAAALSLQERYGDQATMVVLPADHLIRDTHAFTQCVQRAAKLAEQGYLVTFGIVPSHPETGFGYIEAGTPLNSEGAAQVARFVEKPNKETAIELLASGQYLWNSGMFCFTSGTLIQELEQHAPALLEQVRTCIKASACIQNGQWVQQELDAEQFACLPDISIDYALLEHSNNVAVIPATFDWSDIGTWNAMGDLVQPDEHHNRASGQALFLNSHGNYVQSEKRLITTLGVDNLIVIDTDDALLVAHKDQAQSVRDIVQVLKATNHEAYRVHPTVHRPWGTYTVLEEGSRFKIKRIRVKPGAALSLQMHHHRSEHWVVVQGMAKIVNGGEPKLISCNESTFIPAGKTHRLENPGVIDLVMIEVQSGEYLGEDDIVRFEDQYGRVK